MATHIEINMQHTTGLDLEFFATPAEAVAASGLSGDDECSVFLMIDGEDDRSWAVVEGLDSRGIHTTAAKAADAQDWFEDEWCYTTDRELADRLNNE